VTYGALDLVVLVLIAGSAVTHGYSIVRRPRDGRRPSGYRVAFALLAWPCIALMLLSQLAVAGDRPVPADSVWPLVALVGAVTLLAIVLAYRTFIRRR
jgi:hypothetical protein